MTTTNKSKKQLVLVLMSGFFASALVGCNGDSSGSQNSADNNKPMSVPQYPIQYDFIKQVKQKEISIKNKRNKLKSTNGKSLQTLGDTLDTVTDATNFLNIFAVAVPEIGFITAPATFIEGIFSSDGLDTTLSDIASSINTLQDDITTMETQITAQNNTIQANFIASETNNFNNSAAAYNSSVTAINNIWNKFNGGITTIGNTSNWTPESGIDFTNNQNLPQASQWTYTNDESTYDMSLETAAMGGFQTQPNGSIAAPDPSITSTYQNVLAANLQLFQANEFKNSYGSLINSTPGFNVANDIRAYNANVAQYYYEGLKQIHYLYVIQKTANILNYQAESAGYAGPLSSFNGLSFNYSSGAAVESSNTTVFLQKQENLDAWAVGASNMLFQNTMQYIISDTPFQNQLGYNPPQPSYPYGAIESV